MKEPEFYKESGYEDIGYISPELSSMDTYPDYIHQEVLDCVRRIRANQTTDTLSFAFLTDLHYAINKNHEIRMKRTINAYKEIAARVHIDKMVLGGDYTNEGCKEYKSDCYCELRAQLRGLTYFPVNGNHDDGTIWDARYLKAEKAVNHLTHDDLYKLFYNHLPYAGACFDKDNHALYYYSDDNIKKTRYIFLDSGDIPYVYDENGRLLYEGQGTFTLSQMQINWLVNEALQFGEEGWSVIFVIHSVALPSQKEDELTRSFETITVLNDILDCYYNKECMDREYYEGDFRVHVKADFSKGIKADVIGLFAGDYHRDFVERTKSGIPYIFTENVVMYSSVSPTQRVDGEKSEILFDIVTVNKKERKIYITRVGAGNDRVIEY